MKINRAIGLGLVIIILQFLVADVWGSFEGTLLQLFDTLQVVLEEGQNNVAAPVLRVP